MPPVPYSPTATSMMAAPSPSSGTPRRFVDSDDATNASPKQPQLSKSILTTANGAGARSPSEPTEQALPRHQASPRRLAPSAKDTPSKDTSLSPSGQRRGRSTTRLMGTLRSVFTSVDVQLRTRCAAPQGGDYDDHIHDVEDIDEEWQESETTKRRSRSPVDLRRHHQRRSLAKSRSGPLTQSRKGVSSPNCMVYSTMVDNLLEGVQEDAEDIEMKKRQAQLSRRRIAAIAAARSKRDPKIWGPTHSVDTEDLEAELSHEKEHQDQGEETHNEKIDGCTDQNQSQSENAGVSGPQALHVTEPMPVPHESQPTAIEGRSGDDDTPPTIATTTSPPAVQSVASPDNEPGTPDREESEVEKPVFSQECAIGVRSNEKAESKETESKERAPEAKRYEGTLSPPPGAENARAPHDGNLATNAAALVTAAVVACSPEAERSLNKMWESAAAAMNDFLTPTTSSNRAEPQQSEQSSSQSSATAQRRQFLRDWQQEESKVGSDLRARDESLRIVEELKKEESRLALQKGIQSKAKPVETEGMDDPGHPSGPRFAFSDHNHAKKRTDEVVKKGKHLAREEHVNGTDSVISSSTAAEGSEPIEVIFEAMGDDGLKRRVHMSKTEGEDDVQYKTARPPQNTKGELNRISGTSLKGGDMAEDDEDEIDRYHSVGEKTEENGTGISDFGVEVAKTKSSTSSKVSKGIRINPRDTPTRKSNPGVPINSSSTDSRKHNATTASASPESAPKRSRGGDADSPKVFTSNKNTDSEVWNDKTSSGKKHVGSSESLKRPASAPPCAIQSHVTPNKGAETHDKVDPGTDLLQVAADAARAMFGGGFLGPSSEGQQQQNVRNLDIPPPPPPPPPPPEALAEGDDVGEHVETKDQKHEGSSKRSRREKQHIAPFETLEVRVSEMVEFERSISELTMRSSYGEATARLNESRRMAYYAVGKHHHRGGSNRGGGNRRCYFTGHVIVGGAPFYAGSVQQGLRTLVVFCLPVALGYAPSKEGGAGAAGDGGTNATGEAIPDVASSLSAASSSPQPETSKGIANAESVPKFPENSGSPPTSQRTMGFHGANGTPNTNNTSSSRLSSVDGTSYASIDSDERDLLLRTLPEPSQALLDEMKNRYPEQFNTLPVQVRSPHCWRLFVKFCFFSGLPIAEGEMHYKVRDEIALEAYGDEIILSHDVMEAVNGEQSADILRLPNKKTFRYLRKHYTQQSGKLPSEVFDRKSWELVRPEF